MCENNEWRIKTNAKLEVLYSTLENGHPHKRAQTKMARACGKDRKSTSTKECDEHEETEDAPFCDSWKTFRPTYIRLGSETGIIWRNRETNGRDKFSTRL